MKIKSLYICIGVVLLIAVVGIIFINLGSESSTVENSSKNNISNGLNNDSVNNIENSTNNSTNASSNTYSYDNLGTKEVNGPSSLSNSL